MPTRSRPKRFEEAVNSLLRTSTLAEVFAYLDDDDPEKDAYGVFERVTYFRGPRMRSARAVKFLMTHADTDFMMFAGDDLVFKTPGWDVELMKSIPSDGIGLAFAHDEWKGAAGHYVFHRKWYELTGMFPDVFDHFGPDGYSIKVMETLDRKRIKSLPHLKIAHVHFRNGKAEFDKTYQDSRSWGDGRQALEDALRDQLPKDVAILKAYLGQ